MKLIAFPFHAQRRGGLAGILSRQLPALLAERLAGLGVDLEFAPFFAARGERIAHVILESPLPADVLRTEVERRSADRWITAELQLEPGARSLRVELGGGPRTELDLRGADTLELFGALERGLCGAFGWSAPAVDDLPPNPKAFEAWLTDRDNAELWRASSLDVLGRPEAAWEFLVQAATLAPDFTPAADAVRARIDELGNRGWPAQALAAAMAWAAARDSDLAAWQLAEGLAERAGDRRLLEQCLERQVRLAPVSARPKLRFGVFLLRNARPGEAMRLLEEAALDLSQRDAAETYLGVALAQGGEVARATEYWRRVVAESRDSDIVRIAQENLRRAESPKAQSEG